RPCWRSCQSCVQLVGVYLQRDGFIRSRHSRSPSRLMSRKSSYSRSPRRRYRARVHHGYNAAQTMPLATGAKLGPYEVVGPLGAGGMGEVYRARDTRLERTVAVKILPPQLSSDPARKQRFERKAKTIS